MAIHWADDDPDELKAQQRKEQLRRAGLRRRYGVSDSVYPTMDRIGLRGWLTFFGVLAALMVLVIGVALILGLVDPGLTGHLLSPFNCGSCRVPVLGPVR